jgi:ribosomal protein L40E
MSNIEELERCQKCGASVEAFASRCRACGADLFDTKVKLFGAIRDGGGMTEEAFEAAIEALIKGPAKPRDDLHR